MQIIQCLLELQAARHHVTQAACNPATVSLVCVLDIGPDSGVSCMPGSCRKAQVASGVTHCML